jgi:aminocarboxymuconate-semialdehyde decarboxylase
LKTVDLHNHVIPRTIVDAIAGRPGEFAARLERGGPLQRIVHDQGFAYPLFPEFTEVEAKLESMDRRGIDVAAISAAPTMYYYWADAKTAIAASRLINDGIAGMVAERPERLRGMASLPLQDPRAAVAELERVVRHYGFRAAEIGTTVEGVHLADARYRPLLRRAEELGVFLFAHPYYLGSTCGLEPYYLTNLIGNPLDTAIMAAHLMLSGALDEFKDLRILLAHGGGFLPYQVGRLAHGHAVRPESRMHTQTSPLEQVRRFYFDSITHHPQALRFLIDLAGADRIALGTDAPFDMGLETPVAALDAVPRLSDAERAQICCGTAFRLLREPEQGDSSSFSA